MIKLKQLDDQDHLAFEELLRENWRQNWSDEFAHQIVQWRYYNRPAGAITWLAMENDRCVGLLDSMIRPYLLDGQRISVRETADWYCTPERRPYGVGLWLLRQAAAQPEPVFVLGGSTCTLQLLPKLRWSVLPSATGYVLPIRARGLMSNMIRQQWWQRESLARMIPNIVRVKSPRRVAPPAGQCKLRIIGRQHDVIDVPPVMGDGLVELFEQEHWTWLIKMPAVLACPIGVMFDLDDETVGFSFSQIEPTAAGLDAKIIHLQGAEPLLGWIVSETSRLLADMGVGFVRCCVSTPAKIAALEQVGFIKTRDVPCHWSAGSIGTTPSQIDAGFLRGDDAMPFQALRGRQLGDVHV